MNHITLTRDQIDEYVDYIQSKFEELDEDTEATAKEINDRFLAWYEYCKVEFGEEVMREVYY